MDVDLGVQGQDGSCSLEPGVDSPLLRVGLDVLQALFDVLVCVYANLTEVLVDLTDSLHPVLRFDKHRTDVSINCAVCMLEKH